LDDVDDVVWAAAEGIGHSVVRLNSWMKSSQSACRLLSSGLVSRNLVAQLSVMTRTLPPWR
jgi:hypothetical protein